MYSKYFDNEGVQSEHVHCTTLQTQRPISGTISCLITGDLFGITLIQFLQLIR